MDAAVFILARLCGVLGLHDVKGVEGGVDGVGGGLLVKDGAEEGVVDKDGGGGLGLWGLAGVDAGDADSGVVGGPGGGRFILYLLQY